MPSSASSQAISGSGGVSFESDGPSPWLIGFGIVALVLVVWLFKRK